MNNYYNLKPIKLEDLPKSIGQNRIETISMDIDDVKMYYPTVANERLFALLDTSSQKCYIVRPQFRVHGERFSFSSVADELFNSLGFAGVLYADKPYKRRKMTMDSAVRALYIHFLISGFDPQAILFKLVDYLSGAFPKLRGVGAIKTQLDISRRKDSMCTGPVIDIYGEKIPASKLSHFFVMGGESTLLGQYLCFRIFGQIATPLETAGYICPENPEGFLEFVQSRIS